MGSGDPEQVDALIVGAGITSLTAANLLHTAGYSVHLLERTDRIGGAIRTYREDGFTFESGPTTAMVSNVELAQLLQRYPDRVQIARPEAKRRLILRSSVANTPSSQRFYPLPSGPLSGLMTPLFSWRDKLGLLLEPFRHRGTDPNESLASMVRRRLGESILDYAVNPFVGGIYAGNPERLITRFALPKLYRLEQEHGSFIRGAIAKARSPKSDQERLVTKELISMRGGLDHLPTALGENLGADKFTLSASRVQLQPESGVWRVHFYADGVEHTLRARHVVTTVPTSSLPELLPFLSAQDLAPLLSLRYAPIVQVAWGLRSEALPQFHAFGGLIPSHEDPTLLGILHPSACFPDRAPEGGSLLSLFLGGMRNPSVIDWSDEAITTFIRQRLRAVLGLETEPSLVRIFRHREAIPQYELGTEQRLIQIDRLEQQYTGLHLAGALCGGIGLPDRIKQGTELAERISASLHRLYD